MRFPSTIATMFGRRHGAGADDTLPLEQAAGVALEAMRRRELPLARLALTGHTEAEARLWVGNNIFRNAAILGRCEGSDILERIPDGARRRLTIRPDWSGAGEADTDTAAYSALCVPQTQLDAYLGWARSVV